MFGFICVNYDILSVVVQDACYDAGVWAKRESFRIENKALKAEIAGQEEYKKNIVASSRVLEGDKKKYFIESNRLWSKLERVKYVRDDLAKGVESAALEKGRARKACEDMLLRALEAECQLDSRPTTANAIRKYKGSPEYKGDVAREAWQIVDKKLVGRVAYDVAKWRSSDKCKRMMEKDV